ncbi:MAG: FAA hydrolase family protein [Spirochaetaceae bacterium]|nr:MAG: FAA hydrolase family protein [Spirochaetaceae bacterium]
MSVELPIHGVSPSASYTLSPSKILCLGLNYADHIKESVSVQVSGFTPDVPKEPVLFPKTPNTLVGPGEPIRLPSILADYAFEDARTDHEAELALIIGTRMKDVDPEDALDYLFGCTCANDVSQRNIQNADRSGWYRGKSFDTFCPVGPVVVPISQMPDIHSLDISCRVNGRTAQSGNTSQMIFSVEFLLSFLSRNFTLEPGDLILTGTPSGVGPIRPGDVVEVEIAGIGILSNPVLES